MSFTGAEPSASTWPVGASGSAEPAPADRPPRSARTNAFPAATTAETMLQEGAWPARAHWMPAGPRLTSGGTRPAC